jgi:hypothetical protein
MGATGVTLLATWLAVVVTAVPTVVTVLPTTTTGAVGLPDPGGAGAGGPVEPPTPEPGGPLWDPAGDGTTVTVVPGGTTTVTAGGGPLRPAWTGAAVRNVGDAPLGPDRAACAALAPARPDDNALGEPEPPPTRGWEPACVLSTDALEP